MRVEDWGSCIDRWVSRAVGWRFGSGPYVSDVVLNGSRRSTLEASTSDSN